MVMPVFDHTHKKIANKKLLVFHQHEKISSFHQFILEIRSILENFDHAQPKTFPSNFNSYEFVSTCKKWGYFICLFWRYGWLKNLKIWLAEKILANISQEQKISQLWDFHRNTSNNMNFNYRTNWIEVNDEIRINSKSPVWGPKIIFCKIQLCHAHLHMEF